MIPHRECFRLCSIAILLLCQVTVHGQGASPLQDWLNQEQPSPQIARYIDVASWDHYQTDSLSGLPVRVEPALMDPATACEPSGSAIYFAYDEHRTVGDWMGDRRDDFFVGLEKIERDFAHMYTGKGLRCLGLTLAIAAPLANTEMDQNFSNWYQRHVRSRRTDEWARVGNKFGEHWITVPVFLGAAAAGTLLEDYEPAQWVGDWGKRSIRAMIVGSPSVGLLQYGLGAGRPGEYENSSRWRPFHDNNSVAGHGFVGAVPFLTAASMTESRPLKALFFAGSFWTCAARINNDAHFLSQSILGWSIAYIAVRSVTETENEYRRWEMVPLEMPQGGTGIGVLIRF